MLGLLLWSAQDLMRETFEQRFRHELAVHQPIVAAAVEPLLATRDYGRLEELVKDSVGPGRLALLEVRDGAGKVLALARHADAGRLHMRLQRQAGEWRLDIHDDGKTPPKSGQGNGLNGMRERIEALGGQLQWRMERGMPLSARWPVRA